MLDLPPDGTVSMSRIAEMLAPTLGWEKSMDIVGEAVARLHIPPESMTREQGRDLLGELGRTPGMVGIAARFARSRLDGAHVAPPVSTAQSSMPPPSNPAPSAPRSRRQSPNLDSIPPPSPRKPEPTVTADEIANLLSGALGAEKAAEIVLGTARRLGMAPERIDKEQAMALLDQLAAEPGIIGLAARFTKARLILRFAA